MVCDLAAKELKEPFLVTCIRQARSMKNILQQDGLALMTFCRHVLI